MQPTVGSCHRAILLFPPRGICDLEMWCRNVLVLWLLLLWVLMSPFLGPRNFTLFSSIRDTMAGKHVRPEVRRSQTPDSLVREPEADGAMAFWKRSLEGNQWDDESTALVVSTMSNLSQLWSRWPLDYCLMIREYWGCAYEPNVLKTPIKLMVMLCFILIAY